MRRAERTAVLAVIASCVESGRIVHMLFNALTHLMFSEELVAAVDVDTAAAQADLESLL